MRESWEKVRFLACCLLQPYSRKPLKASDVCRFGWDESRPEGGGASEESTRERFEELVRRTEGRTGNPDPSPPVPIVADGPEDNH